jgi:hypothetical protein
MLQEDFAVDHKIHKRCEVGDLHCKGKVQDSVLHSLLLYLATSYRQPLRWIRESVVEFLYLMGGAAGLLQAFQEMFDNEDRQS